MAKKKVGKICISDIPKNRIYKNPKNEKEYIDIILWESDTPNQYGSSITIQLTQLPEEVAKGEKRINIAYL